MEDQPAPVTKNYVKRIDAKKFEEQKTNYTQYQLQKLFRSPGYKKMRRDKGNNPSNWNWQARQRYYQENNLPLSPNSSDEDIMMD